MVFLSPWSNGTTGCQFSFCLASAISGQRWVGSSDGSGEWDLRWWAAFPDGTGEPAPRTRGFVLLVASARSWAATLSGGDSGSWSGAGASPDTRAGHPCNPRGNHRGTSPGHPAPPPPATTRSPPASGCGGLPAPHRPGGSNRRGDGRPRRPARRPRGRSGRWVPRLRCNRETR